MKSLILTIGLSLLVGCSLSTGQRAAVAELKISSDICNLFPAITYDGKADTVETKTQVKRFNAKRNAYCNYRGVVKNGK